MEFLIKEIWSEIQTLNIKEQLESGIRYLDLRLTIDDDDKSDRIHLTHSGQTCYDSNDDILYLNKVLNDCVMFLIEHPSETVIVHFKDEKLPNRITDFGNKLAYYTVLNETIITNINNEPQSFNTFLYNSNTIPQLEEVRSKIVLLTRSEYKYNIAGKGEGSIGNQISIPEMGGCYEYRSNDTDQDRETDGERCYPVITGNILVQDNYNLERDDKWDMIHDVLRNNIPSRNFTDSKSYFVYDKSVIDTFYNSTNENVLILNFMNMARVSNEKDFLWFDSVLSYVMDTVFDSSIENSAAYVNDRLVNYSGIKIHNQWVIMDYPSSSAIRKVYESNEVFSSMHIYRILILGGDYVYTDSEYYIYKVPSLNKRNENTITSTASAKCIRRKLTIDESNNKYYAVTTNSECTKNTRNQWYFKQNGKYYNIISSFDNQCLMYEDDELDTDECNKNNIYQDFVINDKTICSRADKDKCLDGKYKVLPATLERDEYKSSPCSTRFIRRGYKCCSSSTEIDHVDEIGSWGFEDGELCGISFDTLDIADDSDSDSDSDADNEEVDADDVQ